MFKKGETKLKVSGMSCSHCERSVTEAAMSVEGVSEVKASAKKGYVQFKAETNEAVSKVRDKINELGFKAE